MPETGQPGAPGTDAGAQIEALRARGAQGFDPVGLRFIEAMARRAASRDGSLRRLLDERLESALDAYRLRLDHATEAARETAASGRPAAQDSGSPLAELLAHIGTHTTDTAASASHPLAGAPQELRSMRYFRRTWSRLSVDRQLSRALDQAPANAGPLNSHHLVLQTLKQMREISPEYVEQFMSWVDALMWLEQADGGRSTAQKNAPANEAGKKRKPARRKAG